MRTAGSWQLRVAVATLVLGFLIPTAAPAQGSDADERAIAAYRLSDASLAKYVKVWRAIVAAGVGRDTAEAAAEDEEQHDPTLAEIAAMYDKHPASRRALVQAGFTSREFVIFTFALMQAGMAAWLVDQHGWQQLPKDVARENVVFYQRHRAELDSLTAEMKSRQQEP